MADCIAKEAASPSEGAQAPAFTQTDRVDIGSTAFEKVFWPHKQEDTSSDSEHDDEPLASPLSNLNRAIKHVAQQRLQTGLCNDTMYTRLWDAVLPAMDGQASNAFWTSKYVSEAAVKQLLKARYGQLWNKHMAHVRGMPYMPGQSIARDSKCPLCSGEDSTSHFLGGCLDSDMLSWFISRHDEAARICIVAMKKGSNGNRVRRWKPRTTWSMQT